MVVLLAKILFRARFLQAVISGVVICSFTVLTDLLATALLSLWNLNLEHMLQIPSSRLLFLIIGHFFWIAFMLLACQFNRHSPNIIPTRVWIPFFPCWLVSILLCCLQTWQLLKTNLELHPMYLIVMLGMLYINIMVIYYTRQLHIHEQEIAEHHYAMQQEYYDQFCIQQEETRALWHDIHKYLRAAKSENTALTQLDSMLSNIACVVDVNNRVVSVILNEYVIAARESGIHLTLDVQIPAELFIPAADLYVLIGNTMDNAIQACVSLPVAERWISIKLRVHNNILFYEIENPYSKDHFATPRGKYHGYGLKNVERCAKKYSGNLKVTKLDGRFQVSIYLNH